MATEKQFILDTKISGLLHHILDADQNHIATIQQFMTGTNQPTGVWTFEIIGRPGESRKSCHRSFRSARLAWDACVKKL